MEKKLQQKVDDYVHAFMGGLESQFDKINIPESEKAALLEYMKSYEKINIEKDDLVKRKRSHVSIPGTSRCISKRSDGEQCSRRKKDGCDHCGTHSKGSPYGTFNEETVSVMTKISVWAQEIGGILYYIDLEHNVYNTEDIINNKQNPRVVAKYKKTGEIYTIPDFHI